MNRLMTNCVAMVSGLTTLLLGIVMLVSGEEKFQPLPPGIAATLRGADGSSESTNDAYSCDQYNADYYTEQNDGNPTYYNSTGCPEEGTGKCISCNSSASSIDLYDNGLFTGYYPYAPPRHATCGTQTVGDCTAGLCMNEVENGDCEQIQIYRYQND